MSTNGDSGHSKYSKAASSEDSKQIGENAKNIIAEDEQESKPSNLETTEVNGKVKSAEELAIFPITR